MGGSQEERSGHSRNEEGGGARLDNEHLGLAPSIFPVVAIYSRLRGCGIMFVFLEGRMTWRVGRDRSWRYEEEGGWIVED